MPTSDLTRLVDSAQLLDRAGIAPLELTHHVQNRFVAFHVLFEGQLDVFTLLSASFVTLSHSLKLVFHISLNDLAQSLNNERIHLTEQLQLRVFGDTLDVTHPFLGLFELVF